MGRLQLQTADEALASIAQCRQQGRRLWGVDGFRVISKGYIADLDLILAPSEDLTIEDAASAVEQFIRLHAAPDVLFEIVPD